MSPVIYLEKLVPIIDWSGFSVGRFYRFPSSNNLRAVICYCRCCCFNRQLSWRCDRRFRRFRRPFVLELELLAEFGVEVTKNGWRRTTIGGLLSVVVIMKGNTIKRGVSQKKVNNQNEKAKTIFPQLI